jgi:RNA polymerase sigma factor (sigma-70 family)
MQEKESALIERFLNGEKCAFEELMNMYQTDVYRLCYYYVKNRDLAEDLRQDIFFSVYKNLATFRNEVPFKVWLFKIVYNKCMEFLRRKPAVDKSIDELEEGVPENPNSIQYTSQQLLVKSVLEQLPSKMRNILELFYLSNLSCSEIAKFLDMSESAVKTTLFRARQILKEKLNPNFKG